MRAPVWVRKGAALDECPVSYISAQSVAWMEEYSARRRMGALRIEEMGARDAEAFLLLEELLAQEREDGQRD